MLFGRLGMAAVDNLLRALDAAAALLSGNEEGSELGTIVRSTARPGRAAARPSHLSTNTMRAKKTRLNVVTTSEPSSALAAAGVETLSDPRHVFPLLLATCRAAAAHLTFPLLPPALRSCQPTWAQTYLPPCSLQVSQRGPPPFRRRLPLFSRRRDHFSLRWPRSNLVE